MTPKRPRTAALPILRATRAERTSSASPRAGTTPDEISAFALTGEAAGQLHPRADGILFLGGSTINYPYLSVIQRTTGKPVFNNTMAFLDYVDSWLTANPRKRVP